MVFYPFSDSCINTDLRKKMQHTYSQLYTHIVFSTKFRKPLIELDWENDMYAYSGGIIKNLNCKMIKMGGMPDHVHIVSSFRPNMMISTLVEDIKTGTTNWIKENKLVKSVFNWQRGFASFSVSHSQLDRVCAYVENQKIHHKHKSFTEEVKELLRLHDVIFHQDLYSKTYV